MADYSDDLRADLEEALRAAARTKRIMDRVHQKMNVVPNTDATDAEVFAAAFREATATTPTEIETTRHMAHLAGKLEHHEDADVRSLAGLVLRHVRRQEGEG